MSLAERVDFLRAYVRNRRDVGSVTPSSRFLARALAAHVPPGAPCVAELGAGTGAVTRILLERLGAESIIVAFETDAPLCARLRQRLVGRPVRIVQAPAQELLTHITALGLTPDAVVSGLPFGNFSPALGRQIVGVAHQALTPGGIFVGYSYGSLALPSLLKRFFGNCRTEFVLLNLPPAYVFSSQKVEGPGCQLSASARRKRAPEGP